MLQKYATYAIVPLTNIASLRMSYYIPNRPITKCTSRDTWNVTGSIFTNFNMQLPGLVGITCLDCEAY